MSFLDVQHVDKNFSGHAGVVKVLKDVSFTMEAGDTLAITGPSGSGKSTLLHLIGTLDQPSSGQIRIRETDPKTMSDRDLAAFRNQVIGFVFQDHHLLPQYSALENILIPTLATKKSEASDVERAVELMERVGLAHRESHRPSELSGGERQRVAIARALINQPELVLCDEPTGNLDGETADEVATLLFDLQKETKSVLILVTHDLELAGRCHHRFCLDKGRLTS